MKAPQIKHWIRVLRGGKLEFDEETRTAISQVFEQIQKIEPCGEYERREVWLKADRGTIEDYGDYNEYIEEEIVLDYGEFETMWLLDYPDEVEWIHLVTIEHEDYRAIYLGRELIYQSKIYEEHERYECPLKELFLWIENALKTCIFELQEGTYNQNVYDNLAVSQRTGIISRKDYWDIFPEVKKSYLSDISDEEIEQFVKNITEQKNDQPVGKYIKDMTAGMFYEFCSIGYKVNNYENLEELSAKQQYYRKADGRDEGLSRISLDSSVEFEAWYQDNHRGGGHPWEVCRGGNSTHIDLFVRHCEHGYYLEVAGKAWSRSIEAIKFYNALRGEGVAVSLRDAKGITDRLLGRDRIGIVPEGIPPFYCESWFPNMELLDFMHLPYEREEYEKMLPRITWLAEKEQRLF